MTKTHWQFSLRAVLILTAIISVVMACAANYPEIALIALCATVWMLFASGGMGQIVVALSRPAVYSRYPILATFTWLVSGLLCVAASGVFWWAALSPQSQAPFWGPLMPALWFGAFGCYCLYLLWRSLRRPPTPDDEQTTADQ